MSKGRFDEAIRILKTTPLDVGIANEVRDAFVFLEAAGKVDKERAIAYIDERIDFEMGGYFGPPYDIESFSCPEATEKQDAGVLETIGLLESIGTLVAALPDGGRE